MQQVELVAIGSVRPHPDNPRQGDIGAICESIAVNGWYGAVIVSRRPDGDVILAGEHRWRALTALQRRGWTDPDGDDRPYGTLPVSLQVPAGQVPVIPLVGLDETAERRILVADNRSNDLSTYDDAALAALLSDLASGGNLLGTLYDGDELDQLLDDLNGDTDRFNDTDTDGTMHTIVLEYETAIDRDYVVDMLGRICRPYEPLAVAARRAFEQFLTDGDTVAE